MSMAPLGKQGWSEPRCVYDLVLGFGTWSEINSEPEEHAEEGDEHSAFSGGRAGRAGVRVDVDRRRLVVIVCELGVRRHGGGRGLSIISNHARYWTAASWVVMNFDERGTFVYYYASHHERSITYRHGALGGGFGRGHDSI